MFPTFQFYGNPITTRQIKTFLKDNKYVQEEEITNHVENALTSSSSSGINFQELAATAVQTYLQDTSQLVTQTELQAYKSEVQNNLSDKVSTDQLTNYALTTDVANRLSDYTPTSNLQSTYATKQELQDIDIPDLSDYVSKQELAVDLADKVTNSQLNNYALTTDIDTRLSNYTPTSNLQSTYATRADWDNLNFQIQRKTDTHWLMNNYSNNTQLQSTYATQAQLTAGLNNIPVLLNGYTRTNELQHVYATKTDVQNGLNNKVDTSALSTQLAQFTPTSTLQTTYATKQELNDIDIPDVTQFVTQTDLQDRLNTKVDTSTLSTQLAQFTPTSTLQTTYATKQDLNDIDMPDVTQFVTQTDLQSGLNDKVDTTVLNDRLALYSTTYDTQQYIHLRYATMNWVGVLFLTTDKHNQDVNTINTNIQTKYDELMAHVSNYVPKVDADATYATKTQTDQLTTAQTQMETDLDATQVVVQELENKVMELNDRKRPVVRLLLESNILYNRDYLGYLIYLQPSVTPEPTTAVFVLNMLLQNGEEIDIYNGSSNTTISFNTTGYGVTLYRDPTKTVLSPNGCAHVKHIPNFIQPTMGDTNTVDGILIVGHLQAP